MKISESVIKKDHSLKITGEAIYVADYPTAGILFGKLLRSAKARARVLNVKLPNLPEGYLYVDKDDVPAVNRVHIVEDDTPVFVEEIAEFVGDPIGMLVGPDEDVVNRLLEQIIVEYEELTPVLQIEDSDTVFFEYNYSKGDPEKALLEADQVFEEQFETGLQEHAYLETQGLIARPDGNRIHVHGSLQCPYYVHSAVAKVLGFSPDRVVIQYDVTGGAFGGKEDYPSILAAQVAVAALKANRAVRVIFGRREDMEFTSKRHPSKCNYRVAVKNGTVTAMDIDIKYNSGAYTTLSKVVLQRGVIASPGVYNVENIMVRGRAYKTNTVPNGAFRGFGAPQPFFAVEMMMSHVASKLGVEPLLFKEKHLAKQGDSTSTNGKYHFPVPLQPMIEQVDKASNYRKKRKNYQNQTNKNLRRGVGISLCFHGAGFTGSGERDLIKAVAKLHKYPDNRVELLTSITDMGQGVYTSFAKIISKELNIPIEDVIAENPNTGRVPDSGPTVASRSIMVVGELLRRAAIRLREQWQDGEEQIVEEHFRQPDFIIPFDQKTFQGDAYPTYAWAVSAVEVELDMLTGVINIIGAYGSFDAGTPIDRNIVLGQTEGGLLQGLGFASTEQMTVDDSGRIRNNSFSDYIIPTAMDVPNMQCMLYEEKYPHGPYGAKGVGELPTVVVAGAYLEAVEQALSNSKLNHIPFSAEDAVNALRKGCQNDR